MASACTSVLAHIESYNLNLIKHHSSCLAGVSGLSLLSALNFHASDFISLSYGERKRRVKVWGCRFHLVNVFWTAAGTDPGVLLPSWDVCQHQQLQSGGDGGRHSRLWCGAATLGQEPGGVCAHQSSGKEQALWTLSAFLLLWMKHFTYFRNTNAHLLLLVFFGSPSPSATSCITQSRLPEFCCPHCFFLEMLIQRDSVISWWSPSSSCYSSLSLLCGHIAASAKWSNITSTSAPMHPPLSPRPLHLSLPAFPLSTNTSGARSCAFLCACMHLIV